MAIAKILLLSGLLPLAAMFFPESVTPEQLKADHQNHRTSVLIIPGHFNNPDSGARHNGLKELELTREMAGELERVFRVDPRFVVFTEKDLGSYLADKDIIRNFVNGAIQTTKTLISQGTFTKERGTVRNRIPEDDALKLYAVNKWANDNRIDIVLHAHFNDYPGRGRGVGKYGGFAIFIPEDQLPSHRATSEIAESVKSSLNKYFPVSDNPLEDEGVIEDQNLIATGAFGTLRGVSLLLEYGYVYESQIITPEIRPFAFRELAYQTYLGVKKFFEPDNVVLADDSAILPYSWQEPLRKGLKNSPDVFALQLILSRSGFYPPVGFSKNDCPVSGNFGDCTTKAVMGFQKKYGLVATGFADGPTLVKLNNL